MGRPVNTLKTVYMNIGLPEDLAAKILLRLYSDLEGRVPYGAQQEFFTKLVRDHFEAEEKLARESKEVAPVAQQV